MAVEVQVRDVAHGGPACGVEVRLEHRRGAHWSTTGVAITDDHGLVPSDAWPDHDAGTYRLVIDAWKFFASLGLSSTQSEVSTVIRVADGREHHRVSVLLTPFACAVHTEGLGA